MTRKPPIPRKEPRMTRLTLYPLFVAGALAMTGCSLLQSPTPKSNALFNRYAAVDRGTGKGQQMQPSDEIALPEQWATGAVKVHIDEQYDSSNGTELLTSRILVFERTSDAGPAAELAKVRAGETATLSKSIADAVSAGVVQGIVGLTTTALARTEAQRDVAIVREQQETERARILPAEHGEEAPPAEEPGEPPATPPAAPSNPTDPAAPTGS